MTRQKLVLVLRAFLVFMLGVTTWSILVGNWHLALGEVMFTGFTWFLIVLTELAEEYDRIGQ